MVPPASACPVEAGQPPESSTLSEVAVVVSGVSGVDTDMSPFEQLRVEFKVASTARWFRRGQSQKKKRKGADTDEKMGMEMDNLVNAATRPFKCYRAPITVYYENDQFGAFSPPCELMFGNLHALHNRSFRPSQVPAYQ